ncbi:peptidoglycan DD-metalloendopeptidase family protein [Salinispirillum sp. LH 10-3-1]|uniref:Peptidoglycan DD-metalloendopeptidase family protein n=1 Tax=Salinispirillum sp. LH 10-3-1 TaxID=2952525 RepID=A0AB38YHT7_9GAMM
MSKRSHLLFSILTRSRCGFWVCCLLAALLFSGLVQAQQPSSADVEALKQQITALQERLGATRAERTRMERLLEETEREMSENRQRLSRIEAQLATTERELAELRGQLVTLEAQRKEQATRLESILVSVYKSGQQTPLKALLSPESLSHGQRMMTFYQFFNAAQLAELQEYEETLKELADVETGIAERQTSLVQQNQALVDENNRLMRSRNQRQQVVARLAEEAASQQAQIAQKEAERKELEALVREVEAAITQIDFGADELPFVDRRGQMTAPVEGSIRIRYGERNSQTGVVYDGLLFDARTGSPVRAVHYGRVVFADWLRGYGLLLILDHGQGYLSLYGRNESLMRNVGDWVRAGETIAHVGDSGGFERPGLYFEIRHNGATTNPQNWIRR